MKSALILIDIQNDFLPEGALGVPHGDEVIAVANRVMPEFDLVVASRDWHPPRHESFASNHEGKSPGDTTRLSGVEQTLWPDHCVQHTKGAELAPGLDTRSINRIFFKGTAPNVDSYSTFFDNARKQSTGLDQYLRDRGVTSVYLLGLATDYCVKFSALDALSLGYETNVIVDGCRAVGLSRDDETAALREMEKAGARLVTSDRIGAQ